MGKYKDDMDFLEKTVREAFGEMIYERFIKEADVDCKSSNDIALYATILGHEIEVSIRFGYAKRAEAGWDSSSYAATFVSWMLDGEVFYVHTCERNEANEIPLAQYINAFEAPALRLKQFIPLSKPIVCEFGAWVSIDPVVKYVPESPFAAILSQAN